MNKTQILKLSVRLLKAMNKEVEDDNLSDTDLYNAAKEAINIMTTLHNERNN